MTWLDYTLLIIIALSALYGFYRGIVREILSLVVWVFSFWVAVRYAHYLAGTFEGTIANDELRYGLSYAMLLIVSLIVCTIAGYFAGKIFSLPGIGFVNRSIGMLFGIFRGLLIATILVFFGNMTAYAGDPLWQQSTLIATFSKFATWAMDFRSGDETEMPEIEER
ncbi:MAG TPA: CvpA family protein [Gammaproteobacteria bacterium]